MRPAILLLALAGCGSSPPATEATAPPPESPRPVERYAYVVSVDPSLSTLDVTVCFDGPPGEALYCPQAMATMAVRRAEVRIDGEVSATIEPRGRELPIPADLAPDACVGYVVSIDDAIGASWSNGTRVEDAVLVNASAWLWAPEPLADDATGTLRVELPDGIDAAFSYPRGEDGVHQLDRSAFHYLSHTVFGRFERFDVDVPGGRLEVARLPGELALSDAEIGSWLSRAGQTAAQVDGRFPVEHALVAVVPVGGGDDVAFGNVGRGGGSSVMLLTSRRATFEGLVGDWVPPHEFTHLAMPFVRRSDAWMSEGVATYYQEVLRARGGVQSPLDAWRNIDHGFASGRDDGTGRSLEVESAQMFRTASFRRVYWAGTAIALLADVELRKRGNTLDEAIGALEQCCMTPPRTWGGRELAGAFDRITGTSVYSDLAERFLPSHDFPEVEETLAWLGLVRDDDGELELAGDAPGIAVRDAIMAPLTRGSSRARASERSLVER